MLKPCTRAICLLTLALITPHAMSQDISGWSDKTVCRLVKSNGGADYLEEAASRGLDCEVSVKASKTKAAISKSSKSKSYSHYGRSLKTWQKGDVTIFDSWNIPQYVKPDVNDATLAHYFEKERETRIYRDRYQVQPAGNAIQFEFDLKTNAFLTEQMRTKSLVSYLYYEDGKIIYDEIWPSERHKFIKINDSTELGSASVGKSVVSYVVGHAICEGYVDGLDVKMDDWPLIENTLYEGLPLIDVLNMTAGDQHIINSEDGFIKSGRHFNTKPMKFYIEEELKGSISSQSKPYNYHGFATHVAMNYVIFKAGDNWQNMLDKVFQQKVKIKYKFFFKKHNKASESSWISEKDGLGWYNTHATRYDYLRIAKAMLDDWNDDTCVGQYLKSVYERRVSKNIGNSAALNKWLKEESRMFRNNYRMTQSAKSYGGQFHFDFGGMRNRKILGMSGYGGQSIMIDFDNSRINVVNAVYTNYDWYELSHQVIKNGKLKD